MVLCCSRGAKHVGEDVWSDLGNAAYTGNLPRMIQQLSNGGDVNAADANGFTPIHRAAQSGNFEAVQLLLKCGADARCSATKRKNCQAPAGDGREGGRQQAKYGSRHDAAACCSLQGLPRNCRPPFGSRCKSRYHCKGPDDPELSGIWEFTRVARTLFTLRQTPRYSSSASESTQVLNHVISESLNRTRQKVHIHPWAHLLGKG